MKDYKGKFLTLAKCQTSHSETTVFIDGFVLNSNEIAQGAGISASELTNKTQAEFLLLAYQKMGQNLFEKIRGEMTLVIWDGREKSLFLVRDKIGVKPVYYIEAEEHVAFANRPDVFETLGHQTKLDLSDFARIATPGLKRLTDRAQFYSGVKAIPPAHYLKVTPNGASLHRYWQLEAQPNIQQLSVEEANEGFRDRLKQTIEEYYATGINLGALMSGGLDSSALVSLAQLKRSANDPLLAMSSADFTNPDSSKKNDAFYVNEYLKNPNLKLQNVTPPKDDGPFSEIESVLKNVYSPLITSHHFQYSALGEASDENQIDLVMDGAYGEFGASFRGDHILVDAMFGLRDPLWAAKMIWQRADHYNRSLLRQIKLDLHTPIFHKPKLTAHGMGAYFRSSFLEEHCTDGFEHRENLAKFDHFERMVMQVKNWQRGSGELGFFGAGVKARRTFPFLDPKVLEFGISVQQKVHMQNGYARALLREAMRPYWSDQQRTRTSNSPFVPNFLDYYHRQRDTQRIGLEAIPAGSAVREILDIPKLIAALAREDVSGPEARTISNVVYIAVYLQMRGL